MSHPYHDLPSTAFWRTAVAELRPRAIANLWDPKHPITKLDKIATFGSCFAQHISRSLAARNYNWFDAEMPDPGQRSEASRDRNYGIFSARTGNIYTAAALRQWVDWAMAKTAPPDEVWEKDGRYFDPFRPAVEPSGFSSPMELFASREITLRALRDVITRSNHFVFTLGLTEAWVNREGGYTYAVCPGTAAAGEFNPAKHAFKNFDYAEILADMLAVIATLRLANQDINVLLTVSPVPLTATASGKHVLVATTHSKSVLRAVAGYLSDSHPWIDYFPSYEIITGLPFRARFYESNLRSVASEGVEFVMQSFFECLNQKFNPSEPSIASVGTRKLGRRARRVAQDANFQRLSGADDADLVCEEVMLDAFAPKSTNILNILTSEKFVPDSDATKICIIGNSHIGALRKALIEEDFVDRKMDIVFWGIGGEEFLRIKFENGRFTHPHKQRMLAVSSGRYETINPKDFAVLVFVGAGFDPGALLNRPKEQTELHPAALEERLRQRILKSHALELMKSAARGYSGKILFVPTPFHSELSSKKDEVQISQEDLDHFNRAAAKIFAENGIGYVAQPLETIRDNKRTRREYSLEYNFGHMNGLYGSVILSAIRDRLRAFLKPNP